MKIEFGSEEFWQFYDDFCSEKNLQRLVNGDPVWKVTVRKMREITTTAHQTREIHKLKRPEKNWKYHRAWLTLEDAQILTFDGRPGRNMDAGDIIVVQYGWDRDVIATHYPIDENIVSGYFLSGKWENMIGLFLPLFDRETILTAIKIKLEKNHEQALSFAQKEAAEAHW